MKILDKQQILRKIQRLTVEILERNFGEKEIILVGINRNGLAMASLLGKEFEGRTTTKVTLTQLHINPAKPLEGSVFVDMPLNDINNKVVILIDDVANTGRTFFYAIRPFLDAMPKKVEVAVLVDRKHKSFPIQPDYVGLSLATTLKENIDVQIKEVEDWAVYLN
ncbi:MAG: phosphoribosyltransferase family protein [Saprospiraceae bacterium]|nr:phosphoribosyltransferase family protein [Saprospiraceae bacterium]